MPGPSPSAAPFAADGDELGALVLHGFTGSPVSIIDWARHLADAGLSVRAPLLPGHGTSWQDMNTTRWEDWYAAADSAYAELTARCSRVVVCGLSMGGTLALRLAEMHPGPDGVAGVVGVNAALDSTDRRAPLTPLVSRFVASLPGIGDDIAKPGVTEGAYPRIPLKAAASLGKLFARTRADLGLITAPVLAFRSAVDHVVPVSSLTKLQQGARRTVVTERVLPASYHVATLDFDGPTIFAETLTFARGLAALPDVAGGGA